MFIQVNSSINGMHLFNLYDACREKKSNSFHVHSHATTEFGYFSSGSGKYYINDKAYNLEPGMTFLIKPNQQHCIPTITSDKLESVVLHITPYFLWSVCSEYISDALPGIIMGQTETRQVWDNKSHYFTKLSTLLHSDNPQKEIPEIKLLVLNLLIDICSDIKAEMNLHTVSSLPAIDYNTLQNTLNYIDAHIAEQISLENLTKVSGLCRTSFSRMFKQYTGLSATDYIITKRIERAMYALRSTNDPIAYIALNCGFNNLSNFNRLFKQHTSQTPKEYRMKL